MTIACLGWGSLCWNPGSLPIEGDWRLDGPTLPLEFARVSSGGRVTLVVTEVGAFVPVLWAPLVVPALQDAIAALADREKVTFLASIGRVPEAGQGYPYGGTVAAWAAERGLSGVVWTALKPGISAQDRGQVPTLGLLRHHLDNLDSAARADALEYVVKAPAQVQTPYRKPLQEMLESGV